MLFEQGESVFVRAAEQPADENESAADQVLDGCVVDVDRGVAVFGEFIEPLD